MSDPPDLPAYRYGEDVERYLHDKGITIEDLIKQHKRNTVANGDEIISATGAHTVGIKNAQAMPIGHSPEKWESSTTNVDVDWSKVLERDSSLSSSVFANKPKRTAKSSKKSTVKKSASSSKKSVKASPLTKTQLLRDKKKLGSISDVKAANVKKISKSESTVLASITGKSGSSKKTEEKTFLPKKTQDDEVLDILTSVLGGKLGEHAVRQTVQSSPFFSSDPAVAARLKALGQSQTDSGTESKTQQRDDFPSEDHPELQIGIVAAQEGSQDTKGNSSKALIGKLDNLVRKINSKADQVQVVGKKDADDSKDEKIVQERAARAAMTTEDIVTRATDAGVNTMTYTQIEAVTSEEDTPKPLLSPYLMEAFSHPTTLVLPENKYSRILFRPNVEPYGLDEDTGPAYRENPPSTISYGGPVPPLESRKVRPITDTSPQIQDPINHIIKTPWEDVLADKRTVAAPCKRTTILQKDFVPSDVDLGLDDVETIDPTTISLPTEAEKAKEEAEAETKVEEEESFHVDDVSQMKANAEVPEVDADPINQNSIDVKDEPPKGLVQELTAAIVAQLKAEGILAGGHGPGNGQNSSSSITPEILTMLMAQQQNLMMQNNFNQSAQPEMDGVPGMHYLGHNVNLADRTQSQPITTLGSALLTARIAGMSYDNQAPLRGIKTATMNPYRPVVAEQAKANVWQARAKPPIGGLKPPGGVPASPNAAPGADQTAIVGTGSAVAEDKSKAAIAASRLPDSSVAAAPLANANAALDDEIDLNKTGVDEIEARHISDEEPTLTAEQQKDLFTKCLNNRAKQVEELFSLGVPVDTFDEHGNTCLHVACQCGSKRMVKACLRWGSNINKQNKQGQTALHYCFAYKYEELAAYLVKKGADDTIVNNFGLTCYEGLKPEDEAEPDV